MENQHKQSKTAASRYADSDPNPKELIFCVRVRRGATAHHFMVTPDPQHTKYCLSLFFL